jgi:hypothetical protein
MSKTLCRRGRIEGHKRGCRALRVVHWFIRPEEIGIQKNHVCCKREGKTRLEKLHDSGPLSVEVALPIFGGTHIILPWDDIAVGKMRRYPVSTKEIVDARVERFDLRRQLILHNAGRRVQGAIAEFW